MKALIEQVRVHSIAPERLKGKGKGKEMLTRYNGEVIEGEPESVPSDPRKAKVKRLPPLRPPRTELVEVKYEVRHVANLNIPKTQKKLTLSLHCSMMQILLVLHLQRPFWL